MPARWYVALTDPVQHAASGRRYSTPELTRLTKTPLVGVPRVSADAPRLVSVMSPRGVNPASSSPSASSPRSATAYTGSSALESLSRKMRRDVRPASPIHGSLCWILTSISGFEDRLFGDTSTRAVRVWHRPNRLRRK